MIACQSCKHRFRCVRIRIFLVAWANDETVQCPDWELNVYRGIEGVAA